MTPTYTIPEKIEYHETCIKSLRESLKGFGGTFTSLRDKWNQQINIHRESINKLQIKQLEEIQDFDIDGEKHYKLLLQTIERCCESLRHYDKYFEKVMDDVQLKLYPEIAKINFGRKPNP